MVKLSVVIHSLPLVLLSSWLAALLVFQLLSYAILFSHLLPLLGTETIVAEVYAVGYPHCQSTVRYRAVAVTSYALTYFDVDPSSGEVKRTSNPRPALRSAWRVSAVVHESMLVR